MLGKDRFNFESPNAIDAGEAPPSNPGRRGRKSGNKGPLALSSSTRSPRSSATVPEIQVHVAENLFRGEKIKIENSDHSGGSDRHGNRYSTTSMGSLSEQGSMEFYDGDEGPVPVQHDQLPSPEDARLYAQAVLTNSFRRLSSGSSDSDDDAIALALEEAKPLSSSAVSAWRRPSRRKSAADMRHAAMMMKDHDQDESRRSCLYLVLSIVCSILILATAVTFFVVVTTASAKKDNDNNGVVTGSNVEVPGPVYEVTDDVTDEMLSSPRFLKTIDWLSEHGISDMKDLTTAGSPQFQAAQWIADLDELNEEIPVTVEIVGTMQTEESEQQQGEGQHTPHADLSMLPNNYTAKEQNLAKHNHEVYERFLQRYILVVMYFSLSQSGSSDDPKDLWTDNLNFLSKQHECSWFRLETGNDGKQYPVGVTCNEKMLVQEIFIPNNNLQGSIPSELQFLRHLELLSLRHNQISGSIPTELGHLYASLEYLDLSKNLLSGSIPENVLGRLHGLKALGLAQNLLQGTLPTGDLTSLTRLRTLDLGYNQFSGHVKNALFNMTDLEYLYLESNQFEDTLDDSFLVQSHQLKELTLNNNKFQSIDVLPLHLLSHPELSLLDLSNNFLEATLPLSFLANGGNVETQLKHMNLRNNQLKGSIPLNIQELSNLEYLDVSRNAFDGTVPVSLGNMKALTHIHLGENNFAAGMIPPTLFTILNLKELSMPMAHLTGQLPAWFSMMGHLEYIDLSGNSLTGEIPDEMFGMPKLSTLLLRNNMLNSTLPSSFPKSQLEILALDNNAVIGDATGICESAENLKTFTYGCVQVICHGSCCHSECCSPEALQDDRSEQCFSSLLSTSLQAKDEADIRDYQVNRTILSFSPDIIREHHT